MTTRLLTTAACAALVAFLPAPAAAQQDDETRAVSPDEYFGTRARDTAQDEAEQNEAEQDETQDSDAFYEPGERAEEAEADTAEQLNERQLRRLQAEREARDAERSSQEGEEAEDGLAARLRARDEARRSANQTPAADAAMSGDDDAEATLSVAISGTERRGKVYVAIQSEDEFAGKGGTYTEIVRPRGGDAQARFEGIAPGRYAVAVFQDTDGDGTLTLTDTGPTEPWGFSGKVKGAPTFDAAAIEIAGDAEASVALNKGAKPKADKAKSGKMSDEEAKADRPMKTKADRPMKTMGDMDMGDMDMAKMKDGGMAMPGADRGAARPALVYRRSASLSNDALVATDFLGSDLLNADGDDVATVEDVIVDPSGRARGVVLAAGGLFGFGADYYAVNFDRIEADVSGGDVTLRSALSDADMDRLRPFDYDAFKADKQGLLLASELRGMALPIGQDGDEAAVDDVIMTASGGVEAVVLDHMGDSIVAPFSRVKQGADGSFYVDATADEASQFARYEGRPGATRRRGLMRNR